MSCLPHSPVRVPSLSGEEEDLNWRPLLHREAVAFDPALLAAPFEGRRILVTGAGGWIGSALARQLARFSPEQLVLLDSAEHGLYEIQGDLASLAGTAPYTTVPGDVCDTALLRELFSTYRPQIVFHAAAYKHVPLMERHPLAALRTNALGTYALAQASLQWGVEQLVMLSTDKAVMPSSIMGTSKRVAELVLLALGGNSPRIKILRLGNVLGSRGSVVPLFRKQIAHGGPVTVTDPDVSRYFLSLRESVELLLSLANQSHSGGLYVPDIGEPVRILDLAQFLIERLADASVRTIPVAFTGLRPGDKMREELLSQQESTVDPADASAAKCLHRVQGPQPAADELIRNMEQLRECVLQRDAGGALQILERMVPEYQPGAFLRQRIAQPAVTAQ